MSDTFLLTLSNGYQYPYQIIHSKRAKYIRIKLSRKGLLSVTLPAFTKSKFAHEFVQSKRNWIEKNLQNIIHEDESKLPTNINLRLLNECWSVDYEEENPTLHKLQLEETNDSTGLNLKIKGNINLLNDPNISCKLLTSWCKKKAKTIFNDMLQELAEIHGFHYQRLSIRAQKTRWGSCSHQKNINLNCKLLFMPEEVVKYVMIHELCHTIEMNHSSRFWALVKDCDPDFQAHKKQLKELSREIPI